MEMNNFYCFRSRHLTRSFEAEAIGLGKDEKGSNYHYNLIQSKYDGINFPVIFKQTSGKNFTDILATGRSSLFLISDRLRILLVKNQLTGWKTYPISLRDKKDNHIDGYYGLSVTGVAGPKTFINSPIIETKYVPEGPVVRLYKGATIDLLKWDGSDFFIPEGTTGIVITKKVAEILEKNKISNLSLYNVAELEMSVDIWNKTES